MNKEDTNIELVMASMNSWVDNILEHRDKGSKAKGILYMDPESRPKNLLEIIHQFADEYFSYTGIEGGYLLEKIKNNSHYKVTKQFGKTPYIKAKSRKRATSLPLRRLEERRLANVEADKNIATFLYRYNSESSPKFLKDRTIIALDENYNHLIVLNQKPYSRRKDITTESMIQRIATLSKVATKKGDKYQRQIMRRKRAEKHLEPSLIALSASAPHWYNKPHFGHLDVAFYAKPETKVGKKGTRVGGDHLVLDQIGHHAVIGIVDVCGHGMLPATFAASVGNDVRAINESNPDTPVHKLVTDVSSLFYGMRNRVEKYLESREESTSEVPIFATYFHSTISNQGKMEYVNAGHETPLLLRRGSERFVEKSLKKEKHIPIGIERDTQYAKGHMQLRKGDILVYYTDGVIDAIPKKIRSYGLGRLKKAALRHRDEDAAGIQKGILRDVRNFYKKQTNKKSYGDDFTFLVVKYR